MAPCEACSLASNSKHVALCRKWLGDLDSNQD